MANMKHPRDIENMSDRNLVELVTRDFEASESHTAERRGKYADWWNMYRGIIPPDKMRSHGANLFIPYTFQLVETAVPKWFNALFGTKPYTTILPAGDYDDEQLEKARKLQSLITYQLDQKIKIVDVGDQILRSVAIYGEAYSKQTWVKKTRKVKTKKPAKVFGMIPLQNAIEVVEEERTVADDPVMKVIPVHTFRYDPTGTSIDSCRWCGEEVTIDLAELKEKINSGVYKKTKELSDYIDGLENADPIGSATQLIPGYESSGVRKKDILVYEYYTDEWEVHVVDKRFMVFKDRNRFFHGKKPYTKYVAIPILNQMHGVSIPECVESLQMELNTTRNQRIDNVSMAINRMWKVLRGSNIRQDQLVSKPNGMITVDAMDDLEEITMQDVTGNAYNEEATIKQDMDMASGVLDSIRGTSTDRRETATTASIMHQSGGDRFKHQTIKLDVTGFSEAIGQIVELNQQFITEDTYINIYGQDESIERIKISPTDILGRFDVVASSAGIDPTANKEVQRNQLTTLVQTFKDSPYVNQAVLTRRVFEAFDLKNVDELIIEEPPEEVVPEGQMTPDMMGGMMPPQMGMPQQMPAQPVASEPTPEMIQTIMSAIETGSEIPPELIPMAQELIKQMEAVYQEEGLL